MWFWHCAASCVGVRQLALRRRWTSTCVRACVRGMSGTRHVGVWLRLAGQERSPARCIVAAFAATSGQVLCTTAAGVCKFIMRRESETESESADFFTNPSETVRLPDFENRNNTIQKPSISSDSRSMHCLNAADCMRLLQYSNTVQADKSGQGGRGLKITIFLRTSFMNDPLLYFLLYVSAVYNSTASTALLNILNTSTSIDDEPVYYLC